MRPFQASRWTFRHSGVPRMFVPAIAVCVGAGTLGLLGATVVLQQGRNGYSGAADAWLNETGGSRDDNYGGDTELHIKYDANDGGFNEDHTILRFTLPALSYSSVTAASLELYFFQATSFQDDNAMGIKPYRVSTSKGWYENTGISLDGQGVSFNYTDQIESAPWSNQNGGWDDRIDDSNGSNKIRKAGGTPGDAIAPPNWVPFDVRPSVLQWYGGQANNGLLLYSSGFQGGGTTLYGMFYSREYATDTSLRPRLTLTYAGAGVSWAGGVNGTWDTSTANWSVGGYAGMYGNGDAVTFPDGGANPTISVTGGGVTPGSVTINNSSTTYAFSGGAIGGGGGLTKSGAGTATLNSANGYTGATAVNGGVLQVRQASALGTTAGGTTVAGGARLELANNIAIGSEPLFLNGTGGGNGALRSVSGNNSWSGGIALDSAAEIQVDADSLTIGGGISGSTAGLTFDGNGTATVNGAIGSGVTTLTKTSGGTLILANGNAFTGEASVSGGVLRMTHGSALGSTAAGTTVTSGARLEFQGDLSNSGEALTLNGTGGGNGALRHIAGNTTWNGGILLGSTAEIQSDAGTLTLGGGINAGSQGLTIDGVGGVQVQTSGISGSGATLTKSGLGTLTLAAGGTFGGTATVSAGTVVIGADAALGSTAAGTTVQPGAMVQMNGGVDYTSPEPLTLAGSGIGAIGALNLRSGISRFAGPITLAANTTIGAANGAQLTVDNSIGGGFALSKAGLGTVVLTGVNPYSGDTTVEAGTLALTGSGSLGTGSAIRVDAGAVLDASGRADGRLTVGAAQTLSGSGQVIGRVVLNGSVAPGASVGSLVTGTESWNPAGSYQWEIQDAVGGAGVGWDLVAINGDLEINASVGDPFRVGLRTLGGPALNFDYNTPYQWTMASVSGVTLGFDAAKFAIDSTGFQNDTAGGAFSLSSGSVKVVFTPNLSPLAQNASYYRRTNTTLKIKIPVLLESYTSDPDGDARDLQWFSPVSDNGVAIVQRGDYLFYETDQNKNDAFRYRVRDVRTSYRPWDTVRTAQNTIKIQMLDDNNASPNIISMRVVDETAELTIAAIPNFSYAIQRTTDLTPPIHWDYIGSQTAPPRGVFVFVDANPPFPPSMAYYRTVEE